jgi:hypothetical protein
MRENNQILDLKNKILYIIRSHKILNFIRSYKILFDHINL